jgi:putative endopeptidase
MKLKYSYLVLFSIPMALFATDPQAASTSGLDTAAMNKSVDPCANFYQYACGNWIATNPIPADRSRWGRFAELGERNEKVMLDLIQGAAAKKENRGEIEQKVGDEYTACMDTAAIERNGLKPIQADLSRIAAIKSNANVMVELTRLHAQGVAVAFTFGTRPDAKDSTKTIANLSQQGALSLPDRSYYLNTGAKSVETRTRFVKHMANMFQLTGDTADAAAAKASLVLDFETLLAQYSLDRVALRDPNKTYNIFTRKELSALTPNFDWNAYFKLMKAPSFETLNVSQPEFLKSVAVELPNVTMDTWKAYFEYHLLRQRAEQLPAAFEKESFDFWQRYLTGAEEQRPRQFRCVRIVDRELGDLLGQKYISAVFGADAKAQITQLVTALEKAMGQDIQSLDWMSAETKKAAIAKLNAITNNVGYPQKWRDYSKVTISREDFAGNSTRLAEFRAAEGIAKIGKPVDKSEWTMSTPTVNAFYSPQNNSINFPAGILQTPFFDPRRDLAINYGGVGAVIGHEMTHGFDDQGRKFDGEGNLRDWWTPADGAEFEKRAACVANEYSGFTAVDDVKLNGRLTLGENTADNGGLRIAFMALEDTLAGKKEVMDGFTPEQRFFLGFAQVWCENTAPQEARSRAVTDPHSPGRYRVNGTVQNMPEFQQAFSCKAPQPMVSENACRVW